MSNLFSSGGAGNVGFSGETQQSLKFNDDESQYLSWTPAAAGNRKTWTWSAWVKRGNLGTWQTVFSAGTGSDHVAARFTDSTNLFQFYNFSSPSYNWKIDTVAVFRDASAFYHLVLQVDSTQATSTDRIKIYINGERQTLSGSYPSLNFDSDVNTAQPHKIGAGINNDFLFDGYLSDVYFIDGQALDASSFGQFTNGYWEAKDYAGTYGTNGFHLTFADDVVSEGFNVATWKGNSPLSQSISGLGFSPDLVWIKSRSQTYNHVLADTVRGQGKDLYSNTTGAESSSSTELISFDADGFSVGAGGSANDPTGSLGFVAWAWDAGSGSAASNTDGSITSTVKANPDYGFSVVNYVATGSNATVGHGLTSAPEFIIVKHRDQALTSWVVYYGDNTDYLRLNSTVASIDAVEAWNDTSPTSTVFSVGANGGDTNNTSGGNTIAYCFHSVAGYSSIGSYSGTGSSGNAITGLGFEPAWLMVKRTDSSGGWSIFDSTRNPSNPKSSRLQPNTSNAEDSVDVDFDDTGFTWETTASSVNASGGTYIYMAFADTREAAFWKDVSGQGNNWTPNNLDYRDSLIDSPANNFAVMNQLDKNSMTLSEGNLRPTPTGDFKGVRGSFAIPLTGKWFFEARVITGGGGNITDQSIGIATDQNVLSGSSPYPQEATYGVVYKFSGTIGRLGSNVQTGLSSFAAGDVLGVAINSTDNEVQFYKNGSTVGSAVALPSTTRESFAFFVGATSRSSVFNFGQDSTFSGARPAGGNTDANSIGDFAYAPPSGYLALCTANLPEPTIIDGSEHFNTVLYTGTGATQSITGVGFGSAPDFVWIKDRTTAYDHHLFDVVRGGGNSLYSNDTVAENTYATDITFEADGFSLGTTDDHNENTKTFVAWNWKAGGTAVSNTAGSITSQVSANVDAGFSIVSYTGTGSAATVGHGLGVVPSLVIWKKRNGVTNWSTQSTLWADQKELVLNSTSALSGTDSRLSTQSSWTSTTLDLGTYGDQNGSGGTYIAYCFANTDTTKVGSYTGNGSTDGPFLYMGFEPSFFLAKRSNGVESWFMIDNKRHPFNDGNIPRLYPNQSSAEAEDASIAGDFLSNGFKIRATQNMINTPGAEYIYLAFAESPFKYATAR